MPIDWKEKAKELQKEITALRMNLQRTEYSLREAQHRRTSREQALIDALKELIF